MVFSHRDSRLTPGPHDNDATVRATLCRRLPLDPIPTVSLWPREIKGDANLQLVPEPAMLTGHTGPGGICGITRHSCRTVWWASRHPLTAASRFASESA